MTNDELGETIERAIVESDDAPGAVMLTGWFLLATFLDEDGRPRYFGAAMDNQTAMTTLGLAAAAHAIERERVVRHHFGQDDGGDVDGDEVDY